MVGVSAAVIADGGANRLGNRGQVANQVFDRFRGEGRMGFEGRVDVVDVRLVVLRMMDFHRPRVDVRFEGGGGVRQCRQCVGHGCRS